MGGSSPTKERRLSAEPLPQRHLVLNVDINKTIVMTDSVTGKTAEAVVNEELAAACWGVAADGKWVLKVQTPSVVRPTSVGDDTLTSYSDWVAEAFPGGDNKKLRSKMKASFTKPGQPGESLSTVSEQLQRQLCLPNGAEVRVIPAFFELLLHLKRSRRSFTLCFRTFGADLEHVAEELTAFCEGRHPLFPGVVMDGSDGEPDYRLRFPDCDKCGTFHREKEVTSLVMGTIEQPGEGAYKDAKDKSLEFYKAFPGVKVYEGLETVSDYLGQRFSQCGTLGIRDYYAYWKKKGMTSDGGKVFLFDDISRTARQHAVFFDDNLMYDDLHIVQPICLHRPGDRPCALALLQSHMCKVEPLHAISERQYFVREVQRLEGGYERRLRSRERLQKILLGGLAAGRWQRLPRMMTPSHSQRSSESEAYDPWRPLLQLFSFSLYSRPEQPSDEEARHF